MLELVSLPGTGLLSSGARQGFGLLETMRVEGGRVPFLGRHLARLKAGADFLGMEGLPGADELLGFAAALAGGKELPPIGTMRLAAADGRLHVSVEDSVPACPADASAAIATCLVLGSASPLRRYKTMSRLEYELLGREAARRGLFETLALNEGGLLADGSRTSLFVVRRGRVLTPRLEDGALPGVARAILLGHGLAEEGPVSPADLEACDGAFLANALRLVIPLARVGERDLPTDLPPIAAATALLRALSLDPSGDPEGA